MRALLVLVPVLSLACAGAPPAPPIEIPAAPPPPGTSAPVPAADDGPAPSTKPPAPVAAPEPIAAPDDPDFPRARDWRASGAKLSTVGPDEQLYDDALRAERAARGSQARTLYYQIIQKYPTSGLVPYAYFAFGEMFFVEAQADPSKLDLAMQAFVEVVKYSQSPIVPEAWARLVDVYKRKGDGAKAANAKRRLLQDFPKSDAAQRLRP